MEEGDMEREFNVGLTVHQIALLIECTEDKLASIGRAMGKERSDLEMTALFHRAAKLQGVLDKLRGMQVEAQRFN
jgi:hypothetical protein